MSRNVRIRNGMAPSGGAGGATEGDLVGNFSDFIFNTAGGVADKGAGQLLVKQNSPTAMSVLVDPGVGYIPNSNYSSVDSDTLKCWECVVTAQETLSISANSAGSTRYDLICLKLDTAIVPDSTASNIATLVVVQGTAGAGQPATPSDYLLLAVITVVNGETAITNDEIDDQRTQIAFSKAALIESPAFLWRQGAINGNFDIWQRGVTFAAPASSDYTADRWSVTNVVDGGTNPTLTHTRQAQTPGDLYGSMFFYRIATNGAGSGYGTNAQYAIEQRVEHATRYYGQTTSRKVTVSFYAKSSITGKKIGIFAVQSYGSGGSPSATENINGKFWKLTTSWKKYSYTFTLNTLVGKTFGTNYDDFVLFRIYQMWGATIAARVGDTTAESFVGSGNIDIAQFQVNAGDYEVTFQPRSFGEELQLCMRYYEKSFPYDTAPAQNVGSNVGALMISSLGASIASRGMINYKVPKRAVPTVTFYNPSAANAKWRNVDDGADSGTAAISNSNTSEKSACVTDPGVAGNAIGECLAVHWAASSEL